MSLNFVSEETLEAKRKKRQEEWEKVRTAEDPEEAPEEEVDDRSLYHRLQEQKEKKEAEKAEEHKLRNMVQGLKKDETDFLNFVANKQLEHTREKEIEEANLLKEMEEARGKLESESPPSLTSKSKLSSSSKTQILGASKRTTQSALLAGVVKKRQRTSSSENDSASAAASTSNNGTSAAASTSNGSASAANMASIASRNDDDKDDDDDDDDDDDCKDREGDGVARVIGVLPGIGEYTDSSGSDSENADETINMKHLGFMKQKKKQKKSNESQS